TPYILVITCENDTAEEAVKTIVKDGAKKSVLKSKSVNKLGIELTYEVRIKSDDTTFVNNVSSAEGVSNAVLVSYNGEYMA
ncbi:MAG: DUF4956 domain-containing protein, partial [Clostridia bacterium]|nr:DUF4956 domain-containing protein [Clostridia bacterium]